MNSVIRTVKQVALFEDVSDARGAARRLINQGASPHSISLLDPARLQADAMPRSGRGLVAGAVVGALEGAALAYLIGALPHTAALFNAGTVQAAIAGGAIGLCAGGLLGMMVGSLGGPAKTPQDVFARGDWPEGTLLFVTSDSTNADGIRRALSELGAVNFQPNAGATMDVPAVRGERATPQAAYWADESTAPQTDTDTDFLGRPRKETRPEVAGEAAPPPAAEALVAPLVQDSWPERRGTHGRRSTDRPVERRAGSPDRRTAPKLH